MLPLLPAGLVCVYKPSSRGRVAGGPPLDLGGAAPMLVVGFGGGGPGTWEAAPATSARVVTPGSVGIGTVIINGPLPAASTHGPSHSWPFVKMLPLTTTRTWYWNRGTNAGLPVNSIQYRGSVWSVKFHSNRTGARSCPGTRSSAG